MGGTEDLTFLCHMLVVLNIPIKSDDPNTLWYFHKDIISQVWIFVGDNFGDVWIRLRVFGNNP